MGMVKRHLEDFCARIHPDDHDAQDQLFEDICEGRKSPCQWFLKCPRLATTTANHPILGAVPVCEKCKAFADGS